MAAPKTYGLILKTEEAYEIVRVAPPDTPTPNLAFICDHASSRLPTQWTWPEKDKRLLEPLTHWVVDIGARELTLDLCAAIGSTAVLARFTRLLCDANRSEDNPTLCLEIAEHLPVELNLDITAEEKERRLELYHRPYHRAVDSIVEETADGALIFSVHSFTNMYLNTPRKVEIGVLFDDAEEALGRRMAQFLKAAGYDARENEPYSGKNNLIYSVSRAATKFRRRYIELEVRQDLIVQPQWRAGLVQKLKEIFEIEGFSKRE